MDEIEGIKISQLPEGTLGTGGYFVIARAGSNYKVSEAVIVNFISNTTTSLSSLNIRTGDLETRCTTIEGDITTLQGLLAQLEIDVDDTYLKLSGGTVTGRIKCNLTPEANEDLVNKQYVDFLITQNGLIETTDQVPEGINNLYFTYDRVMEIFQTLTTDNIPEGAINKYMNTATIVEYVLPILRPILSAAYLPLTGGTVTGQVNEQDPNWTTGGNTSQKEIRDANGKVIYKMTQYGQHYFYGKGAAAVMKFYQKYDTINELVFCEFNTTEGNGWLELSNVSGTVKVRLDSNGVSSLQELTLNNNKLTDVKEIHLTNGITFTDEQKEAMPIGTLFFDADTRSLTQKTGTDTFQTIDSEISPTCKNGDTFTHLNGQPVFVSSGTGKKPVVKLASASSENQSYTIGLATEDVLHTGNALGKYTVFGTVNTVPYANIIKTGESAALWVEGANLYLCSELGKLSTIKETALLHSNYVGTITDISGSNVTIFVRPENGYELNELHDVNTSLEVTTPVDADFTIIKENSTGIFKKLTWANIKATLNNIYRSITEQGDAHGFVYPTTSSFKAFGIDGTRVVTLQSGAGYKIKINGTTYTITTDKTATISNNVGQHFIWFYISGGVPTLATSQTPWDILDLTVIPVAIVSFNGTNGRIGDERHRSRRNLVWHDLEHSTVGARYRNGFTTASFLTANTFSISGGSINDEDIIHTATGSQTTCQILYRASGGATMTWNAQGTAYAKLNGSNQPYYDNNGTLTAVSNNNYGIYWIYMTNCITAGSQIVSVMGQGDYSNIANAQAAPQPTLSGMSVAEWKGLYRVIVRRTAVTSFAFIQADPIYNLSTGPAILASAPSTITAGNVSTVSKSILTGTNVETELQQVNDALENTLNKTNNLSDVTNRQTAVNNLFDATSLATGQTLIKDEYGNMVAGNAGGASQDSIEFPVPTSYTYTGDYITKVVETIEGGTIEKRLRYYISASPIVDGSPDIMEYKNSVTNFWSRATYNYTAGKLTSITTETINAWTI